MNANPELDKLLGKLSAQRAPSLPAGFRQEVWRQIRHDRATAELPTWSNALNRFFNSILRPQLIVAALALALVLGAYTGLTSSFSKPGHPVQLDAFSANAPGLLSSQIK
jgi:hypothetical protein